MIFSWAKCCRERHNTRLFITRPPVTISPAQYSFEDRCFAWYFSNLQKFGHTMHRYTHSAPIELRNNFQLIKKGKHKNEMNGAFYHRATYFSFVAITTAIFFHSILSTTSKSIKWFQNNELKIVASLTQSKCIINLLWIFFSTSFLVLKNILCMFNNVWDVYSVFTGCVQ